MQSKTPPADREDVEDVGSVPSPRTENVQELTPEKWAEIIFPNTNTGRLHDDAWKHAAADVLHGWTAHTMRTGQPLKLSEAAYRGALAAASGNLFTAHPAADVRPKKG